MWNELHGKLYRIVDIVPVSRFDSNNRPLNLPWSNSSLKRMRSNKDKAWNNFNENPSQDNFSYAMTMIYADEEFNLKLKYERKLTNNLKSNCKGFYSYLRNKRQLKTGVPLLERSDGSRTESAAESAEVLAKAFSSVFVREPEGLPDDGASMSSGDDVLNDIKFNHTQVKYELENLNCFKSFGPDGIQPKLLKSLSGDCDFVNASVKLFSVCTDTYTLQSIWKSANLSALFKNGSKTDPLNYRPVSLTCVICKVFEKIIRSFIVDFVENKVSKHQHGFVKGKSCLTNLLETVDCVIVLLDEGAPVDILYFDFKKAFDRVPHKRLIYKLKCMGIQGKVLNVISDFLMNRLFRVCVEGNFSNFYESSIRYSTGVSSWPFIIYIVYQ